MPAQSSILSKTPDREYLTKQLLDFYIAMQRIRVFEERVAELVEQKEIHTPTHLYIGQEAVAVGICYALQRDDYVFGNHRSHGHYLAKGGDMNQMMAEIFGKRTGCSVGRGGSMHLIAPEAGVVGTVPIVSGTIPIAVGAAIASQLRNEKRVSVAFFGDGAMEEGTAHEALNLAGHRKLPVFFVCENNLYASHLNLQERRAHDNIPEIATAHGVPGISVDGNNVVEVHQAAEQAATRCRSSIGPTLLECRTYRWRGHVGPAWDMDVGLHRKDELTEWLRKDPISRLKGLLMERGVSEDEIERINAEVMLEVEKSVLFARESPYPSDEEVLMHVFHEDGEQHQ